MTLQAKTRKELEREVEDLRARLNEAEETLQAIRDGAVDALIVSGPRGPRCFSLEGAETPYRVLIEELSEGVATLSTEGTILYCNRRLAELFAMSKDEIIGVALGSLLPAPWRTEVERRIRNPRSGRNRGEFTVPRRDGTVVPLEISFCQLPESGTMAIGFVATDLTDVKRHEAELVRARDQLEQNVAERTAELSKTVEPLRQTQMKFDLMAKNIVAVFWLSTADDVGRQQNLYVSPAYEEIWGRPLASVYANPNEWIEGILPEDREKALDEMSKFEMGTSSTEVEFRVVRPDGSVRWVVSRGFRVRDGDGKVIYNTGIATDITEAKRKAAELKALQQQLVSASHRAGMAEVATATIHNVGNVLNSVNVSVELATGVMRKSRVSAFPKVVALLREKEKDLAAFITGDPRGRQLPVYLAQLSDHLLEDQARILEILAALRTNLDHVKNLIDIQQSFAVMAGQKERVNLVELIEASLQLSAVSAMGQGLEIIREFAALPPLVLDKNKLLQILVNLIENAQWACHESGRPEKQVTLRLDHSAGQVRIAVADNGIGIAPEDLQRIFSLNFTRRRGGHGFGLHSSVFAVQAMGGSLKAESKGRGQGATFTITLPQII